MPLVYSPCTAGSSGERVKHMNYCAFSEIELRNEDNLYIPMARTNLIALQPLIAFPRIWESFPDDRIKFIRNKIEFNLELKNYFLQQLNANIVCNRLFCPACNM